MQLQVTSMHIHAGTEQIIDNPEKIVDPTRRALAYEFGINNVSPRALLDGARVVTVTKRNRMQQTVNSVYVTYYYFLI